MPSILLLKFFQLGTLGTFLSWPFVMAPSLVFWALDCFMTGRCSRFVFYFTAPDLGPAISPKISSSFCWSMIFTNQYPGTGMLIATEILLPQALQQEEPGNKHIYSSPVCTHSYSCFCICSHVYTLKLNMSSYWQVQPLVLKGSL